MSKYTPLLTPAEAGVLALGVLLALGAVLWGFVAPDPPQRPAIVLHAIERGYMPCPTEDYALNPCYWDATRAGNGEGRSFVWTGDEVFYE